MPHASAGRGRPGIVEHEGARAACARNLNVSSSPGAGRILKLARRCQGVSMSKPRVCSPMIIRWYSKDFALHSR